MQDLTKSKTKKRKIRVNPDLCTGCTLCAEACSVRKFGAVNPRYAGITIMRDLFERFEGQLVCKHCDEPECVKACMSGTMTKDAETGLVSNDPDKCMGCWMCVMVCPYGSITDKGSNSKGQKTALKCDGCRELDTPVCVLVCPTKAIMVEEEK